MTKYNDIEVIGILNNKIIDDGLIYIKNKLDNFIENVDYYYIGG